MLFKITVMTAWISVVVGFAGRAGIAMSVNTGEAGVTGEGVGVGEGVGAGVGVGVGVGVGEGVGLGDGEGEGLGEEPPPPPPPPPPPLEVLQATALGERITVEEPTELGPVKVTLEELEPQVGVNPPSFVSVYLSAEVNVMEDVPSPSLTRVRVMIPAATAISSTFAPELMVRVISGSGPVKATLVSAENGTLLYAALAAPGKNAMLSKSKAIKLNVFFCILLIWRITRYHSPHTKRIELPLRILL